MEDKKYFCSDCGIELDKGEGSVFTVCEVCWDKHYGKKESIPVELPVGMPSETLSCEQVVEYKNFLADIIDTMEKKLIKEEEDFFTPLNKSYIMIIVNIKNEFDRLIASKP